MARKTTSYLSVIKLAFAGGRRCSISLFFGSNVISYPFAPGQKINTSRFVVPILTSREPGGGATPSQLQTHGFFLFYHLCRYEGIFVNESKVIHGFSVVKGGRHPMDALWPSILLCPECWFPRGASGRPDLVWISTAEFLLLSNSII
jgi:hypothetical protein